MRLTNNLLGILFLTSLIWNIFYTIKNKNIDRAIVIAWSLCPLWSLIVLQVSDLVPRYFLISFPSIMILMALFFSDLSQEIKSIKHVVVMIPIIISINWLIFNYQYDSFIKEYNYPQGKFQDIAEVPFNFLKKSIDWVFNDSKINNCRNLILSNDQRDLNYNLWMETEYLLKYVYKKDLEKEHTEGCHYVIVFNDSNIDIQKHKSFGPLVVFRTD